MVCQNKTNKTVLKENLVVSSILGATVLSGILLTLPSVSADDVVDTITITVPTSCSMSSTIATGDEHTAEISNGQSDSAIGETTIKAFCNDNEGFAIYAIGYTDNELGKNVLTNATLGSTHDIVTGTAITGNTSNWAMKLSKLTGSEIHYPIIIAGSTEDTLKQSGAPDFSGFTEIPDDYAKVAYRESGTDVGTSAEGSTLTTTYQAYISPTQAAGAYTGQVKYTMIHPHNEAAPQNLTYMQDLTSSSIAALLPNEHDTATVYDKRDDQAYTIAKLSDGKYWMAENLNLAGGTTISCDTTDCEDYTIPTNQGWQAGGKLPESSANGFTVNNYAYVYNSGNKTNCGSVGQNAPCYSYYSYDAATLGSGRNISTKDVDAPYSICPKGWRLPTAYLGSANLANSDSYNLFESYSDFYAEAGSGTVANFLLAGFYSPDLRRAGVTGSFWSSTSTNDSNDRAVGFGYDNTATYESDQADRMSGHSVRCIFKNQ